MAGPIKTGTIEQVDAELNSGFIVSDDDEELIYFALDDVLKDVGLGKAEVGQMVQFSQEEDPSARPVAKRVVVMSAKAYKYKS
jgi:cold shock CspA family protein